MVRSSQLKGVEYSIEYFQSDGICRLCWASNATRDLYNAASLELSAQSNALDEPSPTEASINEKSSATDFIAKIMSCTGIDIRYGLTDLFPRKICEGCTKTVNKFYKYKVSCVRADKRLKQIFSENLVKLEKASLDYEIKTECVNEKNSDDYDCNSIDSTDDQPLLNLKSKTRETSPITLTGRLINALDSTPQKKKKTNSKLTRLVKAQSLNLEHHPKGIRKQRSETYCNICHVDYAKEFVEHNRSAHGVDERGYNCFGCEKRFPSRKSRLCHETKFCKELKEGYSCGACARRLPGRRAYEAHQREHRAGRAPAAPAEPFRCAPCGRTFKTRANLTQHTALHSKKNFVCEICGRVFNRRDYLRKHIHTHTGQKLYVCPHCGFRATQKSSLTVHIRKHTGERPFSCDVCGQRCVSSSNLLAHRRRHDGLKNFQCSLCGKKFGYKLSLEEHMASTHERLRTHACKLCGATYSRQRGLRRHARVKHGANYDGCGAIEESEKQNEQTLQVSNSEQPNVFVKNLNIEQGHLKILKEQPGDVFEKNLNTEQNDANSNLESGYLKIMKERPGDVFENNLNMEQNDANSNLEQGYLKILNSQNEELAKSERNKEFIKGYDAELQSRTMEDGDSAFVKNNAHRETESVVKETAPRTLGQGNYVKNEDGQGSDVKERGECRTGQWMFMGSVLGLAEEIKPINK